nr:DNA-processing protein DprA [Sphingobium boeckii]
MRLIRSSQIGPVTCHQLISRFGSAQAALDVLPDLVRRGGGRVPRIATQAQVEAEIATVERIGARYLFRAQGLYPRLLNEMDNAPAALIVRGDLKWLDRPAVAIVGARNASAAACRFARILAQGLGDAGISVVSGLARGIDTAAHQGSIDSGTVGVIASGIDVTYPPENRALQEDVATRGVLIAEQPPGTEPLARHFPYRNRIIAGMTLGTVVVEAAPRSGSLITARLANEAGREVMAVPGSPLDPRAQGCNALIRDGATLIQSAADVIESVMPLGAARLAEPYYPFEPAEPYVDTGDVERAALLSLLSHTPVPVDELIRQTGLPSAIVQTVLLELELGGRLQRHAGAKVSLAS